MAQGSHPTVPAAGTAPGDRGGPARPGWEERANLAANLGRLRQEGRLSAEMVRLAAEGLGVSERSVWRWLEAGPPAGRWAHYRPTAQDWDLYWDHRGNVAALWRARRAAGQETPALRTLQAAFARELSPGERAAVAEGEEGRRRHTVYLRWEPSHRNGLWEADHKELGVWVLAPRAQRPCKPWVTLFVDAYSRLIMGWAISTYPSSAHVLAALRAGIVVDAARGPYGGVPAVIRPDRGLEFTATAITRAAASVGIAVVPTPAYTPYLKGKVERLNRTVAQQLLAQLPLRLVSAELWATLSGEPAPRADRFALTARLVEELSTCRRMLVVDEAQRLNRECIEFLRHLHDHPATTFGLLLVGGDGCWDVLAREPMLRSRIYRRVAFGAMTAPQVLEVVRRFHPLYQDATDELVLFVDDNFGHGNFRNWAAFTRTAQSLCTRGRRGFDEDVARNAFLLHAGGKDAA